MSHLVLEELSWYYISKNYKKDNNIMFCIKMNPYIDYYCNQAGSGFTTYSGVRYQKGSGMLGRWFGKVLSVILPAVKYMGVKGLKTAAEIGSDYLNGEDMKLSVQNRLKKNAKDLIHDAAGKAEEVVEQVGKGVKRKIKKTKSSKKSKKPKKSIKRTKTDGKTKKRKSRKPKSVNIDFF